MDPVHDTRAVFQSMMTAMSRPGTIHDVPTEPADHAVLATLVDHEVTLYSRDERVCNAFAAEGGYTEGPLGFGLDAIGLLGVKLDSSPDRVGTGLLQSDREAPNRAQDDYGSAGLTAKARLSATTLHLGTLQPLLPVVMRNDSRLLPQTFRGALFELRMW